jgi:hypothetical protein
MECHVMEESGPQERSSGKNAARLAPQYNLIKGQLQFHKYHLHLLQQASAQENLTGTLNAQIMLQENHAITVRGQMAQFSGTNVVRLASLFRMALTLTKELILIMIFQWVLHLFMFQTDVME